jgi:tetratricopeptide (TPR) repeat protein
MEIVRACANCGETGDHPKCPCEAVRYCGIDCQNSHWEQHKGECTIFLHGKTKAVRTKHGTDSYQSIQAQYDLAAQHVTAQSACKAEKILRKCLDTCYRTQLHKSRIKSVLHLVTKVQHLMGEVYDMQDKGDLARATYDESLVLVRENFPAEDADVQLLCDSVCRMRELSNGGWSVDFILKSLAETPDSDHEALAEYTHHLSLAYAKEGKMDLTMTTARKALKYARKSQNQQSIGKILHSMSTILYYCGRVDEALTCAEEALPVLLHETGEKSMDSADARFILARIYEV